MRCDCGDCMACGSGIMSSAADRLWMCVVHGLRGVDGMCLSRSGVGGEWMRG